MIYRMKDLSPDQLTLLESLLKHPVSADEVISVRVLASNSAPEWLQASRDSAKRSGVGQLSMEEIEAEIEAARRERQCRRPATEQ